MQRYQPPPPPLPKTPPSPLLPTPLITAVTRPAAAPPPPPPVQCYWPPQPPSPMPPRSPLAAAPSAPAPVTTPPTPSSQQRTVQQRHHHRLHLWKTTGRRSCRRPSPRVLPRHPEQFLAPAPIIALRTAATHPTAAPPPSPPEQHCPLPPPPPPPPPRPPRSPRAAVTPARAPAPPSLYHRSQQRSTQQQHHRRLHLCSASGRPHRGRPSLCVLPWRQLPLAPETIIALPSPFITEAIHPTAAPPPSPPVQHCPLPPPLPPRPPRSLLAAAALAPAPAPPCPPRPCPFGAVEHTRQLQSWLIPARASSEPSADQQPTCSTSNRLSSRMQARMHSGRHHDAREFRDDVPFFRGPAAQRRLPAQHQHVPPFPSPRDPLLPRLCSSNSHAPAGHLSTRLL